MTPIRLKRSHVLSMLKSKDPVLFKDIWIVSLRLYDDKGFATKIFEKKFTSEKEALVFKRQFMEGQYDTEDK